MSSVAENQTFLSSWPNLFIYTVLPWALSHWSARKLWVLVIKMETGDCLQSTRFPTQGHSSPYFYQVHGYSVNGSIPSNPAPLPEHSDVLFLTLLQAMLGCRGCLKGEFLPVTWDFLGFPAQKEDTPPETTFASISRFQVCKMNI